ncbi:MAG TPA: hypothetical protein GX517_02150 [Alicyclobacillus sp.]|nr:hypothetical protein [Alicyclobacillus sp.]
MQKRKPRLARETWCSGLDEERTNLLSRLLEEERLFLYPANVCLYLWGRFSLNLPLAKRIPKNGYKSPYWLSCRLKEQR